LYNRMYKTLQTARGKRGFPFQSGLKTLLQTSLTI
jgi:hypothetical protein